MLKPEKNKTNNRITKTIYVPVPLEDTDKRIFLLRCEARTEIKQMEFTQLDFLQIRSYLKGKNDRLHDKITRFIKAVDTDKLEKTDFSRKLPRRRVNEQF